MVRCDPEHPEYDFEAVDRLPFSTRAKSERYRTENYHGAVGLNWYSTDPSLQFTMAYYLLGASFKPSLSLVNALGLSMTSFHGRGFFPGVTQLNDTLTILASIEAFVGLILEATFIATLIQRFFGK